MQLLHTYIFRLEDFSDPSTTPPYAILSHRWTNPKCETTFQDIATRRPISNKITRCCEQARADGLEWVWIDTCCIDKTSSSALSEAVNSMYIWYKNSEICYAYLDDVRGSNGSGVLFKNSKWFTRGWTLQELIAPMKVVFLAEDWSDIGTKDELADVIQEVTKIPRDVLLHSSELTEFSVAQRLSWAADRETTREEDRAYSLMGLFGIHMRTTYGEGKYAFIRLQQKIMKRFNDQTVLAWQMGSMSPPWPGLLAPSPSYFRLSHAIVRMSFDVYNKLFSISEPHYSVTNCGTHIWLPLRQTEDEDIYLAALACSSDDGKIVCIRLQRTEGDHYTKESSMLHFFDDTQGFITQKVYIQPNFSLSDITPTHRMRGKPPCLFYIESEMLRRLDFEFMGRAPKRMWVQDREELRLSIEGLRRFRHGTAVFRHRSSGEVFAIVLGTDRESKSLKDGDRSVWVDMITKNAHASWRDYSADTDYGASKIQEMYPHLQPSSTWHSAEAVARVRDRQSKSAKQIQLGSRIIRVTTRPILRGASLCHMVEFEVEQIVVPTRPGLFDILHTLLPTSYLDGMRSISPLAQEDTQRIVLNGVRCTIRDDIQGSFSSTGTLADPDSLFALLPHEIAGGTPSVGIHDTDGKDRTGTSATIIWSFV